MEKNNKLIPALLDGKDLIDDYIYDMFWEYITTPKHTSKTPDIIGVYKGLLVNAKWRTDSNFLTFHIMDKYDKTAQQTMDSFKALYKELEDDSGSLFTEATFNENTIEFKFYYNE